MHALGYLENTVNACYCRNLVISQKEVFRSYEYVLQYVNILESQWECVSLSA